MTHTVLIVETLILCPALWEMLKGSPIVARLLSLSKSGAATGETKSKIIRIVTSLAKDAPPVAPSESVPQRSRYENVNIRLYEDDSKVQEPPYIPKPRSRHMGMNQRPPQVPRENQSFGYDSGTEHRRSKYSHKISSGGQESSLRNVGYNAIHEKPKEQIYDYNRMEDSKNDADFKVISNKVYPRPEVNFGNEYNFPLDGGARRDPTVRIPFNDNLLHDYCLMLGKENNRDINIFAIQSLEPLIKDCARNIVNDAEKFMA